MAGLSNVDYLVIAFYLVFMVAMGPVFKSFSKTASDFFRGGGNMAWWVAAASMFMTGFTAWTYTGAAGKIHQSGLFFLTLTAANFLSTVVTVFFTAHLFRQMRVITGNEAVRNRFGPVNEQVMTWLPFPFGVIFAGIGLFTIAQFMSCVFDVGIPALIVTLGAVVVVMTMLGGSWAATAGDFVQMVMLVAVSIAVAVLVLAKPEIGGVSGLVEKVSAMPQLYDVSLMGRGWIFAFYFVTLILNQTILGNHLQSGAGRFVFVKTGRDARLICGITWLGALPHTIIFMIPALACAVLYPSLAELYPKLNNPQEAAYVHIAMEVLPRGLMGLLVCGIFAATLTSMNSGLSGTSAQLIRNVYLPLFNPGASEARQIWLGRVAVVVMGVLYVLVGLFFATLENLPLFELILIAAPATGIPAAIPLCLGMFMRRAPSWACWSTVAVGFSASLLLRLVLSGPNIAAWFGTADAPLTPEEIGYMNIGLTTAVLIFVSVAWFLFATWVGTPWAAAAAGKAMPPRRPPLWIRGTVLAIFALALGALCFGTRTLSATGWFWSVATFIAAAAATPWLADRLARLIPGVANRGYWRVMVLAMGLCLLANVWFCLPADQPGGMAFVQHWLGHGKPLTANELGLLRIILCVALPALASVTVLLVGLRLGKPWLEAPGELERADTFMRGMRIPIDPDKEMDHVGSHNDDAQQCKTIGLLCLIYGVFILLLLVFDNPGLGRWCILGCGGIMTGIGVLLRRRGAVLAGRRGQSAEPSFVGRDMVPVPDPDVVSEETLHD